MQGAFFVAPTCHVPGLRVNCTTTQTMAKAIGFTGKCCYPGVRGEGLATLMFNVLSRGGKMRPGPSLEPLFLLPASPAQEGSHWEVNENKGTRAFCSD